MSPEKEPIGVIGVGWVGLVTAACFAEVGHPVIARDILAEKVEALSRGEITIHEPGLEELLKRNAERLTFTTDMSELLDGARLLFVCVDTPPTRSGDADLSRVRSVVEELPRRQRARAGDEEHGAGRVPATRSAATGPASPTSPAPSSSRRARRSRTSSTPTASSIGADPGDEAAGDAVAGLYEPLGGEIVRTDVASAEMIKLASNAFLATKISFVNEIANVCEEVGADVAEVARGMGLDQRIGPAFLRAGIGYGGSCFPKDVSALKMLAGNSGYHFQLLGRGDRGQRAAEAARGAEAAEAPRLAGRQAGGAARPRLQAAHRRHARGLEPGARRAPGRGGGGGGRLRPGRRRRGARALRRRRVPRLGAGDAGRCRRGDPRHRVAGVRRARLGRRGRDRWRGRC